jgi:CheY-like chemotaxis protein
LPSFKEAIDELPVKVKLTIVRDGQQLVELLTQEVNTLPDVLFLDLNMPCKMDLPH